MTESKDFVKPTDWGVRITIRVASQKAAETVHNAVVDSIIDQGYTISEAAYGDLEVIEGRKE